MNPSVLCFRKFPVAKKYMDKMGGSIKILRRKILSDSSEKIVGEPFSVSLFSGIAKFYASEGYVKIFYRNLFVSQSRNIS